MTTEELIELKDDIDIVASQLSYVKERMSIFTDAMYNKDNIKILNYCINILDEWYTSIVEE